MNVISFSLWGDKPKYTIGALRNAQLASVFYRGWTCRFYCDVETVPEGILDSMEKMSNVEVIKMKASQEPHWGGFWRFYSINDISASYVIFRDTDSRLSQREAMAVQEWIAGQNQFHVMRDHGGHGVPVCAGMWGSKTTNRFNVREMLDRYYADGIDTTKVYGGIDQDFLAKMLWNEMKKSVTEHDEFFARKPFPMARDPKHFVGQVYDENNNPEF